MSIPGTRKIEYSTFYGATMNNPAASRGVTKAEVSLEKNNAVVEYDPGKVQVEQLKRSVVEAGFEVAA